MTPYTAILTGGPLATSYQLLQLHMHWGEDDTTGSEHAVDGEFFPMEMHLVHKMETATSPLDIKDGLAVTGFMFKVCYFHPGLKNPLDLSGSKQAARRTEV